MTTNRVKRQHTVPQSLLRRFCGTDGKLFCFDKVARKIFTSGTGGVACEVGFYDLPAEAAADFQTAEKSFGEIETRAKFQIDRLLEQVTPDNCFDKHDTDIRSVLAFFIVLQDSRTRRFRSGLGEIYTKMRDRLAAKYEFVQRHFEGRGESVVVPVSSLPTEADAQEHVSFMFRPEFLQTASEALLRHIWTIGENTTQQPFFLSDAPVIRHPHAEQSVYGGMGLGSLGIEIGLPLTPKYILRLCDRRLFKHEVGTEGSVIPMLKPHVAFYNSHQIISSRRQIYCSEDRFDQVREYEIKHPDLFDPDRDQFDVL